MRAGYDRFDGHGRLISTATHAFHTSWGSFVIGPHNELAQHTIVDYFFGFSHTRGQGVSLAGPTPVTWQSSFTTASGPEILGARFGLLRIDRLGNLVATVSTDTQVWLNAGTELPAAGNYILRDGPSGVQRLEPTVGKLAAPDDLGGIFLAGVVPPGPVGVDIGCGPLSPPGSAFVAHLDEGFHCVWQRAFPQWASVESDGQGGALLIVDAATAPLDLGCGSVTPAAGGSTVIARLTETGACVFGASFDQAELSASFTPGGELLVHGFAGAAPLDLGGGPLAPKGAEDYVIGLLSPTGAHLWSKRLGGAGVTFTSGTGNVGKGGPPLVRAAVGGNVYIAAKYSGAVDFGGGSYSTYPGHLVVASFGASGAHRWTRTFGIAGSYDALLDECGALVVGSIDPVFDVGCGTPPEAAFQVARYQP